MSDGRLLFLMQLCWMAIIVTNVIFSCIYGLRWLEILTITIAFIHVCLFTVLINRWTNGRSAK